MIEIKELSKAFGDKIICNDLNLRIEDGEFVVFSGKSGAGKTTLLNMIGGLESPDSGKIIVDGTDIVALKNKRNYFGKTVGFLFQNFALIEDKTVQKNLEIVGKSNRSGVSIEQALERVGLSSKKDNKAYTLSGGEQQRVALARLMMKKCNIILADEPTGSLDKENANEVMRILQEMNKEGCTVIVVTHDEDIKKMGERIIEI